jgi:hypothetical protein
MVTEMMSHWPVLVRLPLAGDERDADLFLTDEGIASLFRRVRAAYLDQCATLVGVPLEVADVEVQRGSVPTPGGRVSAAVAVVEVFPDHFTMTSRMRPDVGPGVAATATCRIVPAGGVTREVQAELVARAQSARHFD